MRRRSGGALTAFGVVLQLLTFLLGLATVFLVVMCGVLLTGRGSLTLDAQADSPYTVVFGPLTDDRAELAPYLEVQDGRSVTLGNWSNRLTSPAFDGPPRVEVTVEVGPDDRDTRAVVLGMGAVVLGLAWMALFALRRVVDGAVDGDPFHPRNPARFRRLAAAVVAFGFTLEIGLSIIDRTLESDAPVTVANPGPGWPATIVTAVALAALAEVFAVGTTNRSESPDAPVT